MKPENFEKIMDLLEDDNYPSKDVLLGIPGTVVVCYRNRDGGYNDRTFNRDWKDNLNPEQENSLKQYCEDNEYYFKIFR